MNNKFENNDKNKFEMTKEGAIKENKKLAELRKPIKQILQKEQQKKKTFYEKEKLLIKQITNKMKDPNLLIDTIKEVQKEAAGEEDTILSEIIIATTRLVEGVIPESKNFFLSDITGIGKDHVTKKTLEVIIPDEDHYHITKMSPEAFTYWKINESWDKKVIHFEDITQSLLNSPTFKAMASGDNVAVVVIDQKTKMIPIDGKPVMIPTSHHANPEDEALRRFPIGLCDDSKMQTKRIKDQISKKYTGRNKITIDYVLRGAIQSLESYSVLIPYAELIQHFFPEDLLMRTHYHRFLDYISASAVFHQCQRKKTKNNKIIATPDDYMIARIVLSYTTSNPKMIPMSKEYRDALQILQQNIEPMSVMEIFQKCDHPKVWLYRHLPNLVKTGLVVKGNRYENDARKNITTYQYLLDENPNAIPTWEQIGKKIKEIVENTDKTEKTKIISIEKNDIENWFFHNVIKLKKLKKGGFYLVFSGMKIPFYREVLSVFSVISNFLRERDKKRYKKYYQETLVQGAKEDSNQNTIGIDKDFENLSQHEKIQELKEYDEKLKADGHKLTYENLCFNFNKNFIEECKKRKILIPLPDGSYDFVGD